MRSTSPEAENNGHRRVAVTGLGMIYGENHDVISGWENLINGETAVQDITETVLRGYTDVMLTRLGAPVVNYAFLESNGGIFNNRDLRRELKNYHLSHLYALDVSVQAAGHGPTGAGILLPGSLEIDTNVVPKEEAGIIIGSGMSGTTTVIDMQRKLEAEVRIAQGRPRAADESLGIPSDEDMGRVMPSDMQQALVGRPPEVVSIVSGAADFLNSNAAECAASTDAIVEAAEKIASGRSTVAIAGGVEACMEPITIFGFERTRGAVTTSDDPDKAPNPLDKKRDGFAYGESAAVVVLEDLEHAQERNARIYAELRGWGSSADGKDAVKPDESGISRSLDRCLGVAGLSAADIKCVYPNLHAPGTPADITEAVVATRRFRPHQVAGVNSTKGTTGHGLGGAGALESIFTILAVYDGILPPARNMRYPEEVLHGYQKVMREAREFKRRRGGKRTGLKMSSGFGGHNATLLFEEIS